MAIALNVIVVGGHGQELDVSNPVRKEDSPFHGTSYIHSDGRHLCDLKELAAEYRSESNIPERIGWVFKAQEIAVLAEAFLVYEKLSLTPSERVAVVGILNTFIQDVGIGSELVKLLKSARDKLI